MKTILVPTDFSKTSKNAIEFAVEIAKRSKSKLILFHSYYVPIVTTDVMVIPPVDDIEKACLNGLKKIELDIYKRHGKKLSVQCVCKLGFPLEEIKAFVAKNKPDLIVMGMQGGGALTEKLIGSITTSVIRKVKCPVLTIEKSVKFKNCKKIVLACDFKALPSATILKPLKEFVKLFKSSVFVLNVVNEFETVPAKGKEVVSVKLKKALVGVKHSFHFVKSRIVVNGINDFANKQKADMLVMMPHKHSLYENIFFESDSKQMAFHTKLPLLTLHK